MPPAARKPGLAEAAARRDLKALPPAYRNSAVAATYLLMARRLDAGLSAREVAMLAREMRLALLALYDLAPPRHEGDPADELRARREARMAEMAGDREETSG
jgi:hypothetical protein